MFARRMLNECIEYDDSFSSRGLFPKEHYPKINSCSRGDFSVATHGMRAALAAKIDEQEKECKR